VVCRLSQFRGECRHRIWWQARRTTPLRQSRQLVRTALLRQQLMVNRCSAQRLPSARSLSARQQLRLRRRRHRHIDDQRAIHFHPHRPSTPDSATQKLVLRRTRRVLRNLGPPTAAVVLSLCRHKVRHTISNRGTYSRIPSRCRTAGCFSLRRSYMGRK
jgi:hypothetical protein